MQSEQLSIKPVDDLAMVPATTTSYMSLIAVAESSCILLSSHRDPLVGSILRGVSFRMADIGKNKLVL